MPSTDNKRIAKNTLMLYVRMLLMMIVALYTSRVVLEQLGIEDFGIYNVVGGVVSMFAFLNGAMAQASQRFLSYELGNGSYQRLVDTFNASLSIHLLIALIALILAETVGLWFLNSKMNIPPNKLEVAIWVFQFAVLSFMVTIVRVPYNALIISHEKMQIYAYLSIVEVILKLIIAYLLALAPINKLKLYAALMFAVCLLVSLLYAGYSIKNFKESHETFSIKKSFFFPIMNFAGWSLFGTLAWMCKSQGVNIVLNLFFGPLINAAYAISAQVNTAITNLVQNFTTALNPQLVKNFAKKDFQKFLILFERGTKFAFYLMLLISIPLLLFTDTILNLWLRTVPEYAVIFTKLIIVNALLESIAMIIGNAIQATGKIRMYQIVVGITILFNLPFSWLILKWGFSPSIVFIVSIVISVLTLVERIVILKLNIIQFKIRTFIRHVFIPILLVLSSLAIISIPLFVSGWINRINALFLIIPTIIIVAVIEFFIGLTKLERNTIINLICQKLKHK